MYRRLAILTICLLCVSMPSNVLSAGEDHVRPVKDVAIVIDDFGNGMEATEEMMKLPFPITAAVMPFLSTTRRDAEWAHLMGHDVILHLPMEPLRGKKSWLGPGAITCDLTDAEIRRRVNAAIDVVPHAIGINNHMGSKATVDPRVMTIILEVCRERGLFYLDSHTNYRSIASKLAKQVGVVSVENNIFLDDIKTRTHIMRQITLMRRYAGRHDNCVAIGHVGVGASVTAEILKRVQSHAPDINFVGVSKLMAKDEFLLKRDGGHRQKQVK